MRLKVFQKPYIFHWKMIVLEEKIFCNLLELKSRAGWMHIESHPTLQASKWMNEIFHTILIIEKIVQKKEIYKLCTE